MTGNPILNAILLAAGQALFEAGEITEPPSPQYIDVDVDAVDDGLSDPGFEQSVWDQWKA